MLYKIKLTYFVVHVTWYTSIKCHFNICAISVDSICTYYVIHTTEEMIYNCSSLTNAARLLEMTS